MAVFGRKNNGNTVPSTAIAGSAESRVNLQLFRSRTVPVNVEAC